MGSQLCQQQNQRGPERGIVTAVHDFTDSGYKCKANEDWSVVWIETRAWSGIDPDKWAPGSEPHEDKDTPGYVRIEMQPAKGRRTSKNRTKRYIRELRINASQDIWGTVL